MILLQVAVGSSNRGHFCPANDDDSCYVSGVYVVVSSFIDHPRSGMVYNFGQFCMYVCTGWARENYTKFNAPSFCNHLQWNHVVYTTILRKDHCLQVNAKFASLG